MMSIHDSFFVMPNGSRSPYFKLQTDQDRVVVIQDPYFGFDFESYQVVKEEYSFRSTNRKFISDFIKGCEVNARLVKDQVLWAFTGYWSVKNGNDLYIGLGVEALYSTLSEIHSGRLAFCLDNTDFCIFIKKDIEDSALLWIDIYASAVFRPWVEILEPFRRTIDQMAENQIQKKIITEPIIASKSFHNYGQHGLVFPYAISPTEQWWIGPSIIQNHFGSFGVDYLFTQAKGGWLKKDFFKPSQCFMFSGSQHQFDDVKVIRGLVVLPFKYENVKPVFTRQLLQYRKLVELFPE
jgi:hypothetical protein